MASEPILRRLRIFKRLSDRQFERAVNALLILSGVGLIL